jgi:hypothetical protein
MTVYVRRNGVLVDKKTGEPIEQMALTAKGFPTPRVSRMEAYDSPIDGKEVTSWGQREREMKDNDCYDPRDFSGTYRRGREVQLKEARDNAERTNTNDA